MGERLAEVGAASFEGLEEVLVFVDVGVDDPAVGQGDLCGNGEEGGPLREMM